MAVLTYLFQPNISTILITSLILSLVSCASWTIYTIYFHPLARFPGPRLAALTDWWYFYAVRTCNQDRIGLGLHNKYGRVVRIRPNGLSVADPHALDVVMGIRPRWQKTDFYDSFDPHIKGRPDIFAMRDEKAHPERKRVVNHLWTLDKIVGYETCMDRVVGTFVERLGGAARRGEVVRLERLLGQYTLDIIGEVFYGKEGGFNSLKDDIDYKKWTQMLTDMISPLSSMGYVPKGFKTLYFLSQVLTSSGTRAGLKAHGTVIEDAQATVEQRAKERQSYGSDSRNDMVSKMLAIASEKGHQQDFNQDDVATWIYDAIMAGSDTTAITLARFFDNIFSHKRVKDKLVSEILSAYDNGSLTKPIRYSDCAKLPYLSACIRESGRLSTAGIGLPRISPPVATTLPDGTIIPPSSMVTMNWNVIHLDKEVFGYDAQVFRPERWIEADSETAARMTKYDFKFGFGPRICIGKNLANVEMWKVVTTLLLDFDFELVGTPVLQHAWFDRITGIDVKVLTRK